MAKFANGLPVNELGEVVVTSGVGSSNIVGTLPPDLIPVDNITGGIKLNKVALLVTDAGGNIIGLGYEAIPASTPFGPPSTIFRLRMRCTGGVASVSVVATKRSGGTETFSFSLADGDDISESMHASDYKSMIWGKIGSGTVTVEVI